MSLERIRSVLLFPLRFLVFAVGLVAYWMETAADFLVGATSSSQYVRKGSCRRCGRCCQLLAIQMPRFMAKRAWIVRLLILWHDTALNFESVGVEGRNLVYRCRYYRERDGASGCSIHPFRHRLCRFFPKQMLYGKYDIYDDCGFTFVRRNVAGRLKAMKREGKASFGDVLRKKSG